MKKKEDWHGEECEECGDDARSNVYEGAEYYSYWCGEDGRCHKKMV